MTVAVIVYLVVVLSVIGLFMDTESDDSGVLAIATVTPTTEPEPTVTPQPERPAIAQAAIDEAVAFITEDPLVHDAAITINDDTVSMALQVNAAMTPEAAEEWLDSFVRYFATQVSGDGIAAPQGDDLGGIWDHYTLQAAAGPDTETFIAGLMKSPGGAVVVWTP